LDQNCELYKIGKANISIFEQKDQIINRTKYQNYM